MSVQTEIDRIITAVHAAHEKVKEKGGTTSEPYLVANLEDAIGSIPSDGASVETCTVRLICTRRRICGYTYTKVADGVISTENTVYTDGSEALDVTLTDVLCGSFISVITTITRDFFGIEISGNATSEIAPSVTRAGTSVVIVAPMDAGSYSEVTMIDNN